ncbi:putative short chain type dehydrogenase protein [Neofusicoccum parvum]|uniref:Short chain type dehydrogenase protein n=1 Tax=Neofusicoccum parvum TaxID=310453 RepID=A0ACB5RU52_9PEZI|nr:putative short chain type dehydrogenase protein [Neofusicoccum parvum]
MSGPDQPPHSFPTYPDLRAKTALVIGIGQTGPPSTTLFGNGAATAHLLARNGVQLFGCDISLAAAQRTAARLPPGTRCDVMAADATKAADVAAVVRAALAAFGGRGIDVLVNNVGATAHGDPGAMDEAAWDAQIALNLKSVFLACRAVLPVMEKQPAGGVVVNNASITGIRYIGKPQAAYAAAKAAVLQFTRASAVMYAARGVRVNAVVPGLMYTPLVEAFGASEKEEEREIYRRITQHNVPMGRMGEPWDVANAVVFLASEAAKYVTGHALVVDGGITCSTGTGGSKL